MSGNGKKIIFLIALLVLGGAAVWYAFQPTPEQLAKSERFRKEREARAQGQTAVKSASKPAAGAQDDGIVSQFVESDVDIVALQRNIQDVDFEYNIERLSRDPMSPLIGLLTSTSSANQGQPQLGADQRLIQTARLKSVSGIVWDDANPFAVIDNEVVTTGYAYPEGIVVDEILPDHVVFRVNDARVEVELKEQ